MRPVRDRSVSRLRRRPVERLRNEHLLGAELWGVRLDVLGRRSRVRSEWVGLLLRDLTFSFAARVKFG